MTIKRFFHWNHLFNRFIYLQNQQVCARGVIVKAMYCGIVVSEFVFQWRYYFHIRANTLGEVMSPFILPAMG